MFCAAMQPKAPGLGWQVKTTVRYLLYSLPCCPLGGVAGLWWAMLQAGQVLGEPPSFGPQAPQPDGLLWAASSIAAEPMGNSAGSSTFLHLTFSVLCPHPICQRLVTNAFPVYNARQLRCPEEQPLQSVLPGNPCLGLSKHFSACEDAFIHRLSLLRLHSLSPWMPNSAYTSAQPRCMSCRKLPAVKVREAASLEGSCGFSFLCRQCAALQVHGPAHYLAFQTPSVCAADSGLIAKPHVQRLTASHRGLICLQMSTQVLRQGGDNRLQSQVLCRTCPWCTCTFDHLTLFFNRPLCSSGFISQSCPSAASTIALKNYPAWGAGSSSSAAPETSLRCRDITLFELNSLNVSHKILFSSLVRPSWNLLIALQITALLPSFLQAVFSVTYFEQTY